jgi:uncharacterized protein involved in outer membrane biogenesis
MAVDDHPGPATVSKIPRINKHKLAIVASFIAIPVIVVVVLLNFDWNRAKPWLNARTSEMIGRPFAITGDLSLTWKKPSAVEHEYPDHDWRSQIPRPYLVAQDIRISNPSDMAKLMPDSIANIKQFTFSLNPLVLLEKKLTIPNLHFESSVVNLVRGPDGKNNWTFKNDQKSSPWELDLQHINITKCCIHLIDATKHANVSIEVNTLKRIRSMA